MATKKSSRFDVTIDSLDLYKATDIARKKVRAQAELAKKTLGQYGVIFGQVFVTDNGQLRIKGDYLEPEWADEIQKILTRRANSGD